MTCKKQKINVKVGIGAGIYFQQKINNVKMHP